MVLAWPGADHRRCPRWSAPLRVWRLPHSGFMPVQETHSHLLWCHLLQGPQQTHKRWICELNKPPWPYTGYRPLHIRQERRTNSGAEAAGGKQDEVRAAAQSRENSALGGGRVALQRLCSHLSRRPVELPLLVFMRKTSIRITMTVSGHLLLLLHVSRVL